MRAVTRPRETSPAPVSRADVIAASGAARQRSYGRGVHCWAELQTSDLGGATRFYADVFGWTVREASISEGQPYPMLHVGRMPLAGISARTEPAAPHGDSGAAFWRLYAAVVTRPNLDSDGRARREGDRKPARSTSRRGNPTGLPDGALFAARRASLRYGADDLAPPFVLWMDLDGADPRAAASFCRDFFRDGEERADRAPLLLHNADDAAPTSALTIMAGDSLGLPISVGFVVKSCDEVVRRAEASGGRILTGSGMLGALGQIVTLIDPQGATFACWEPARLSVAAGRSPQTAPLASARKGVSPKAIPLSAAAARTDRGPTGRPRT